MIAPAFLPAALQEYEDAVAYLETCEAGLGDRLVEIFGEVLDRAAAFPQAAAPASGRVAERAGARWVLLAPFPIRVVYVARDERLVVVAVFHAHRRPGYWVRRLRGLP